MSTFVFEIFINNQFINSVKGNTFADINPSNGTTIADIQAAEKPDIDKAVEAARRAFHRDSIWSRMNASERGKYLFKLADLIERDVAVLATLDTLDVGKPFKDAVNDIFSGAKFLRYFGGYADKLCGQTVPIDDDYFAFTRLEPVGVCGIILPWNFPLTLLCWKVGPALCAGCTLVIKPAEQTPLSALHFASLVAEAGLPPGVINVVPGFGPKAGAALAHHMNVDKISFTGSTKIGKLIMEAAATSNLKRTTLLLGGKSPCIVFADADVDFAVKMCHFGLFHNMGQCCTAASRCYVQEEIYDEFVEKAVEFAKRKIIGDPFDPEVEHGPQVDSKAFHQILQLIESGKQEGAKLLCGGEAIVDSPGYYIQPTVFADVTDNMRIAKEEIFGPVQQILKFKTLDEVIERANNTNYGLAASIFTKNFDNAIKFVNSVQAGTAWVNCHHVVCPQIPFGGYKESGIGREHGWEGVKEYCEVKTVSISFTILN
ncbi:Retinal dehydrogenase 2 [Trichinella pseudospiralis]|uniref:Retinal dehydrogenase 2 n=2 Tax=Trichinella pseudospiralis TaxID=6337 RepID=A0A0V1IBH3_TRIPS|nr:Retinal dehydrogenase 2 [Trichinella pseudospiralis]KRZ19783.1 Retinal dehydrogenase 2 [Trichinella pseudospiralis]